MDKLFIIDSEVPMIYKRDLYTNANFDYIIGERIIEYDIREAGWNLIQYYKQLPKSEIKRLGSLNKDLRKIHIGNLMRTNKEFSKIHTKSFAMMRKKFMKANKIKEHEILAIRKDSITVIGRECKYNIFDNVEFRKKHEYTSYHKFSKAEMLYNSSTNEIDIKGINDDTLTLHEGYMLDIFKSLYHSLEKDRDEFISDMKYLVTNYKNRKLDLGYYRELNSRSMFMLNEKSNKSRYYNYAFTTIDESMRENIDISYNYREYLFPLVRRFYNIDLH